MSKYAQSLKEYEALVTEEKAQNSSLSWEPLPAAPITPEFPLDCLPSIPRAMVAAIADSVQVPVDLPACALLGCASLAVLGKVSVRISNSYEEPTQLYIAVAAPPSERKSPAIKAISQPMNSFQIQQAEASRKQADLYLHSKKMLDHQIEQVSKKGHEGELRILLEKKHALKEVNEFQLYLTDATPEALGRNMAKQGGRIGIVSAEGAFLGILAGVYSEKVNLDIVLQGYSGESVYVERIGRERVCIPCANVSITLAVQPGVLDAFLKNQTFDDRGVAARFLYAHPKSMVGYRQVRNVPAIPDLVRMEYHRLMNSLCTLQLHEDKYSLQLTPEAMEVYYQWAEAVEKHCKGDLKGLVDGWEGKLTGNTVRIAGILKMLDSPNPYDSVEARHMVWAVAIAQYFIDQLKAIVGVDTGLSVEAHALLASIKDMKASSFSPSVIRQKLRRKKLFAKDGIVDKALLEL